MTWLIYFVVKIEPGWLDQTRPFIGLIYVSVFCCEGVKRVTRVAWILMYRLRQSIP